MNVGNIKTVFIMQGMGRVAEVSCIMPSWLVRAYFEGKLNDILKELAEEKLKQTIAQKRQSEQ